MIKRIRDIIGEYRGIAIVLICILIGFVAMKCRDYIVYNILGM